MKVTRSIARVIAVLVSIGLACGAAELILRVVTPPGNTPGLFVMAGNELEFIGRPYAHGLVSGAPVSFNRLGFRDSDHSAIPTDRVRILMLGDSFTFGVGVREDQTYPRVTEALLNKSRGAGGRAVEVLNLSMPGYNTLHEVNIFQRFGLAFHPDIVVVGFLFNDADLSPAERVRFAARAAGSEDAAGHSSTEARALHVSNDWMRSLKRRSMLMAWSGPRIAAVLRQWGIANLGEVAEYDTQFVDSREEWRITRAALLELKRLCDENRSRMIVAILPAMMKFAPSTYPLMSYHKAVSDFCRSAAITYLDLLPAFWGKDGRRFWLTPVDPHPNAQGNLVIANALASFLEPQLEDVPRFRSAIAHQ